MTLKVVSGASASGAHIMEELETRIARDGNPPIRPRLPEETELIQLKVDTLDTIMEEIGQHPDFVNITINLGEYDVLQGMERILGHGTTVAFPIFGRRDWFSSAFEFLESLNYDIIVCNAAPTVRGPGIEGAMGRRKPLNKRPQFMVACATRSRHPKLGPHEYKASFSKEPGVRTIHVAKI